MQQSNYHQSSSSNARKDVMKAENFKPSDVFYDATLMPPPPKVCIFAKQKLTIIIYFQQQRKVHFEDSFDNDDFFEEDAKQTAQVC